MRCRVWLRDSVPIFSLLLGFCVSSSRDKVQPLTRVPVRATRNVKVKMVEGQKRCWPFAANNNPVFKSSNSPLLHNRTPLDQGLWWENSEKRERGTFWVLCSLTKANVCMMRFFQWRATHWIGVNTHMCLVWKLAVILITVSFFLGKTLRRLSPSFPRSNQTSDGTVLCW